MGKEQLRMKTGKAKPSGLLNSQNEGREEIQNIERYIQGNTEKIKGRSKETAS